MFVAKPKCVYAAATAAKSLQSCLTLCDPIDGSPPSSPSLAFSRQEQCSRLPFPSPRHESEKWKWSRSVQFSSVQSLSQVRLFVTPWIAACQASLSITNSRSLLKLMSTKWVMPSSHLILCRPLLLLPPNPSQHQGLFQWVSSLHQVAKVLEFQLQHQSFWWTPRTDLL